MNWQVWANGEAVINTDDVEQAAFEADHNSQATVVVLNAANGMVGITWAGSAEEWLALTNEEWLDVNGLQ